VDRSNHAHVPRAYKANEASKVEARSITLARTPTIEALKEGIRTRSDQSSSPRLY